jgi:hypothetical protein
VLSLFLLVLLLLFVLTVLLTAWTLWFQGYIYSEPVGGILWRGPAAGGALTLFLVLWMVLAYRSPGRYGALHEVSGTDTVEFKELWVVTDAGKEEHYRLGTKYAKPVPTRPAEVIVKEDGEKVSFKPERDAAGNFKIRKVGDVEQPLRYLDDRGRVMTEDYLGQLSVPRRGSVVLSLLLNFLHLGVWFACLWLLLRFQWPHALGLAVAFWAVTTLFVVPMVLNRTEAVAAQRATAAKQGEARVYVARCPDGAGRNCSAFSTTS